MQLESVNVTTDPLNTTEEPAWLTRCTHKGGFYFTNVCCSFTFVENCVSRKVAELPFISSLFFFSDFKNGGS